MGFQAVTTGKGGNGLVSTKWVKRYGFNGNIGNYEDYVK